VSEMLQSEALLRVIILIVPLLVLFVLLSVLMARKQAKRQHVLSAYAKPADVQRETIQETATPMNSMTPYVSARALARDEIVAIERQIAEANASGKHNVMAAMYLELAAQNRALGLDKEAQSALRSAAGIGAQHGPGSVHAAARIALAEAALENGDLTTACEQWQLARTAFQRDGNAAEADGIDKRMRANGCPTDWVLTDF
jgi:hypothetical protein